MRRDFTFIHDVSSTVTFVQTVPFVKAFQSTMVTVVPSSVFGLAVSTRRLSVRVRSPVAGVMIAFHIVHVVPTSRLWVVPI